MTDRYERLYYRILEEQAQKSEESKLFSDLNVIDPWISLEN